MANVDKDNGFKPVSTISGAPISGQIRKYVVLAADTTAVGLGDAVKLTGTSSADGFYGAVRSITATSDVVLGVVVGFEANPDNLNLSGMYRSTAATAKDRGVFVAVGSDVIFEAQFDGDVADSSIGLNAFTTIATPNTTTGRSKFELASGSVATDVNGQWKIIGLRSGPNDDPTTSWQRGLVTINNSLLAPAKAGI